VASFVDRLFAQIDRWKSKLEPAVTWLEGTGLKDFLGQGACEKFMQRWGKEWYSTTKLHW
jgi:hypothetical protein